MKKRYWGIIILIAVVIVAIVYSIFLQGAQPQVELKGMLGGEKKELFDSVLFKKRTDSAYNLTFDYKVEGSYEMVQGPIEGLDYLFPASQSAASLYDSLGRESIDDEIVFNTPIVLYSRKPVVDALINENVVTVRNDVHYVDMVALTQMMADGTKWADIGLPQLNNRVTVFTTDPNASNSGNMFLGLLANALNNNQTVTTANVGSLKEDIQSIFRPMGMMETSSNDIFQKFLTQGLGGYPIIAGYESQLLGFSKQQKDVYQRVRDDIYILYPEPTVWSSHVYIALTDNGKRGIDALMDKEVQEIAWQEHGYRTIVAGTAKPDEFNVPGLAPEVTSIMQMPEGKVMLQLMEMVKNR